MRMPLPLPVILAAVILLPLAATSARAQDVSIEEAQKRVRIGQATVALGDAVRDILKNVPGGDRDRRRDRVRYPFGMVVSLRRDRASEILLSPPFAGRTTSGIGLGSHATVLAQAHRELGRLREGWNQGRFIAFQVEGGRVTAMKINGEQPPRNPSEGGILPPPRGENEPRGNHPGAPEAVHLDQMTIIWDHSWQQGERGRREWIRAPANAWPVDRGVLLVRVGYGSEIREVNQLIGGHLRSDTPAKDLETPVDFIHRTNARQGGGTITWQWSAEGRGRVRVQVIWFPRERDVQQYVRQHPHEEFSRLVRVPGHGGGAGPGSGHVPPPGSGDVPAPDVPYDDVYRREKHRILLLWDETLDGGEHAWVRGPARSWNHEEGVLLLRAAGGRGARGVRYRVGPRGQEHTVPLGDHVVDADVLGDRDGDRGRGRGGRDPFQAGRGQALYFSTTGPEPVRCQLYWVPRREIVPPFCQEHPREHLTPGRPGPLGGGHGPDPRTAPGFVATRFHGTVIREDDGTPVAGANVCIQLQAWPRTIYGGGPTDGRGRFDFTVAIPVGRPVVVSIPEFREESLPRAFDARGGAMEWHGRMR